MLNVRPATEADLKHVASNMKADDVQEMEIAGYSPETLLLAITACDRVLSCGPEGSPWAVFGVRREGIVGQVWALSTPAALVNWREIHRAAPAILDELGAGCRVLANVKYGGNVHHIRWLKSLGFTFINTFEVAGKPFHEFARIQP